MDWLELKVPPPVVVLLVGVAMWFVAPLGPSLDLPSNVRIIAAVVVALIGGVVALAGDIQFKRAKTTINPFRPQNTSALVTAGIYRHTRNPMYIGQLMLVLAWAVYLSSAVALAGLVVFVLYINRFQIVPEERVLLAKFGPAYADYCSRVRRWI